MEYEGKRSTLARKRSGETASGLFFFCWYSMEWITVERVKTCQNWTTFSVLQLSIIGWLIFDLFRCESIRVGLWWMASSKSRNQSRCVLVGVSLLLCVFHSLITEVITRTGQHLYWWAWPLSQYQLTASNYCVLCYGVWLNTNRSQWSFSFVHKERGGSCGSAWKMNLIHGNCRW